MAIEGTTRFPGRADFISAIPGPGRKSSPGFTLIELLVVMAIMLIMLAMGLIVFVDFGETASLTGSLRNVQTGIALTRQHAITYRATTRFRYGNTGDPANLRGAYWMTDTNGIVGNSNFLSVGVVFVPPVVFEDSIPFDVEGTCSGTGSRQLSVIFPRTKASHSPTGTVTVFNLTGYAKAKMSD